MEEPFPEEQDEEEDEESPQGGRAIMHVDPDCFYAQVEMLSDPELRSKPLGKNDFPANVGNIKAADIQELHPG